MTSHFGINLAWHVSLRTTCPTTPVLCILNRDVSVIGFVVDSDPVTRIHGDDVTNWSAWDFCAGDYYERWGIACRVICVTYGFIGNHELVPTCIHVISIEDRRDYRVW